LTCTGKAADWLTANNMMAEVRQSNSLLWNVIVPGLPGQLVESINSTTGFSNGAQCTFHSIVFKSRDSVPDPESVGLDEQDLKRAKIGDVVTLRNAPKAIVVKMHADDPNKYNYCAVEPGTNLVVIMEAKQSTTIKVRVPGLGGSKHKICVLDSIVVMSFAQTPYKFQGENLPRLLVDLNKLTYGPFHTYEMIVVLLSRTNFGRDVHLLPMLEDGLDHISELQPPDELLIYLQGFLDPIKKDDMIGPDQKIEGFVTWNPLLAQKCVSLLTATRSAAKKAKSLKYSKSKTDANDVPIPSSLGVFPKSKVSFGSGEALFKGAAAAPGGGAGGGRGAGGGGGGGGEPAPVRFYTLTPEEKTLVCLKYDSVVHSPPAADNDICFTVPFFGSLINKHVKSLSSLLDDELISAVLVVFRNIAIQVNPDCKITVVLACFYTLIASSEYYMLRMAKRFNRNDRDYLMSVVCAVIHVPGHWIFIGIAFVKKTLSICGTFDLWEYDLKMGDNLKGSNRKEQVRTVQKFIRYAVSELWYDGAAEYKSSELPRIIFNEMLANTVGDIYSPKQRDNSSCGVGALTNAYFFMHEKRLATIFDYTPDYNGIVGLKRFILAKLMEQEALQAFPQLFAFEGAAENEEMGYARQFEVILNGAGQEHVQILDDAAADKQEMEDIKKALLESKRELNQLEQKEASSVNANVIDLR